MKYLVAVIKFLSALVAVLSILLIGAHLYYHFLAKRVVAPLWGITFSEQMAQDLHLDWKEAYTGILQGLQPKGVRLIAAWDKIEPTPGTYNFDDLDWQVSEAKKANVPVTLTIGQKVPRWPECHIPDWVSTDPTKRAEPLLSYLEAVINHYKDQPGLQMWQLENEPFIPITFGTCSKVDVGLVNKEVDLLRRLDPHHPIILTDSGEWGFWFMAGLRGDIFGSTMYREAYDAKLKQSVTFPLTPEYYTSKADLLRMVVGKPNMPVIVSEVGLEPWGDKQIYDMTPAEQAAYFPPEQFDEFAKFAKDSNFDTYYLWGAEWWYSAKLNGNSRYWDRAQKLIANQ
jgi:hypothetical protein